MVRELLRAYPELDGVLFDYIRYPYARAYYEAFQDWPSWVDGGIVDSVVLMDYSPTPCEFGRWLSRARGKVADFGKVKIAVGAYKLKGSPDPFCRELDICRAMPSGGIVIFAYGDLVSDPELSRCLAEPGR
jgi:uncharacterized lipoprotein YddW (UPF0748 family)